VTVYTVKRKGAYTVWNRFGCLQEPIFIYLLLFHVVTMVPINFYYNKQTETNTKYELFKTYFRSTL